MKYISEEYTAKKGKFKGLHDGLDTWVDLFHRGGESLLREFAGHMATEHDFFAKHDDAGFVRRLCAVVSSVRLTADQFWYYAFKRLNEPDRYFVAANRHCPEDLLEAIWIGNYVKVDGTPDPGGVAAVAFLSNHRKALSIYARRPDLRYVVEPFVRELYEFALTRKGIIPLEDNDVDGLKGVRKVN
jgi:hypothetical protein